VVYTRGARFSVGRPAISLIRALPCYTWLRGASRCARAIARLFAKPPDSPGIAAPSDHRSLWGPVDDGGDSLTGVLRQSGHRLPSRYPLIDRQRLLVIVNLPTTTSDRHSIS
jgi:hypothetical protein